MTTHLELLSIEIETLWLADERGRLLQSRNARSWTAPHVILAVATGGWALAFGGHVSDITEARIRELFATESPPEDPSVPPALLPRCERLLSEELGPVDRSGGPCYIIPPATALATDARTFRSDAPIAECLRHQDFERLNWTEDEWRQLLAGELGPWAFVMDGDRVVSMCHSARLANRGAEAGTWTDPEYRGRGYAAAATSEWASLLRPSARHLFYSTSAGNISSQRVAARLGLPLIGWKWRLGAPSD